MNDDDEDEDELRSNDGMNFRGVHENGLNICCCWFCVTLLLLLFRFLPLLFALNLQKAFFWVPILAAGGSLFHKKLGPFMCELRDKLNVTFSGLIWSVVQSGSLGRGQLLLPGRQ